MYNVKIIAGTEKVKLTYNNSDDIKELLRNIHKGTPKMDYDDEVKVEISFLCEEGEF